MKPNALVIATIAALASPLTTYADDCKYERILDATVDARDELTILASAGSLRVTGADTDEVTVEGRACASSEKLLDRISLRTDDGRRGEIEAVLPNNNSGNWWGKRYASLHLDIVVPRSLALDIDDSSGSIKVDDTGSVVIEDGSGSIEVRSINGDVQITDGSGSINLRDISGNVYIPNDGSGSIAIRDVEGSVTIDDDGSGSIDIESVGSDVEIGSDGSGGIDVRRVAGNFTVHSDGSGGIDAYDIDGELDLPRDKRRMRK